LAISAAKVYANTDNSHLSINLFVDFGRSRQANFVERHPEYADFRDVSLAETIARGGRVVRYIPESVRGYRFHP